LPILLLESKEMKIAMKKEKGSKATCIDLSKSNSKLRFGRTAKPKTNNRRPAPMKTKENAFRVLQSWRASRNPKTAIIRSIHWTPV
jgi:hypothetical protein